MSDLTPLKVGFGKGVECSWLEHCPRGTVAIVGPAGAFAHGQLVAAIPASCKEYATIIVRAVNSYDKMREALMVARKDAEAALSDLLRDGWSNDSAPCFCVMSRIETYKSALQESEG